MEPTKEDFKRVIDQIWKEFPNTNKVSLLGMIGMVENRIGRTLSKKKLDELEEFIRSNYRVVKGSAGGVCRPTDQADQQVVSIPATKVAVAINNHICPHCKNDRVSKDEHSCWKCGGSL